MLIADLKVVSRQAGKRTDSGGSSMSDTKLVTGLFKSRLAAESAVDTIVKQGYHRDDVSVLISDATRSKEFALQTKSHAAGGAGIGGAVVGIVGSILAAIVAVG